MLNKDQVEKLKTIARNWRLSSLATNSGNSYLQMIAAIDEMEEVPVVSEASCDLCGDNTGPLYLHSQCHMTAPLAATIEGDVLTLNCYDPACKRIVAKMVVRELM